MHRQLRALTILDSLISNAGPRFQRTFADEPLLERLRLMPRDDLVDPDVRSRCNTLYRQWAGSYKTTPGLSSIATLYKQLPTTKAKRPDQSRVIRETEAEARAAVSSSPPKVPPKERKQSISGLSSSSKPSPSRPVNPGSTSSFFSRSSKERKLSKSHIKFNLEKEKPQLMDAIAQASIASTNLYNAIRLINRENQRVSENAECKNRFDTCKVLRRQVLRYIQLVEDEAFIGGLLSANDELVKALMAYEVMDKSVDDDSDSDVGSLAPGTMGAMANLNFATSPPKAKAPAPPPKPPTPEPESEEEEEEDENPFADRNAVKTPAVEKSGMTW
jgi:hypothetical protein